MHLKKVNVTNKRKIAIEVSIEKIGTTDPGSTPGLRGWCSPTSRASVPTRLMRSGKPHQPSRASFGDADNLVGWSRRRPNSVNPNATKEGLYCLKKAWKISFVIQCFYLWMYDSINTSQICVYFLHLWRREQDSSPLEMISRIGTLEAS